MKKIEKPDMLSSQSQKWQQIKEQYDQSLLEHDVFTDRCLTRAFHNASYDYRGMLKALDKKEDFDVLLKKRNWFSSTPKVYNLTEEKVERNQAYQEFKAMLNSQSIDVKIKEISSYRRASVAGESFICPAYVSLRLKRQSPSP